MASGHTVYGSTTTQDHLPVLRCDGVRPFLLTCAAGLEGEDQEVFFSVDTLVITLPFRRDLAPSDLYLEQIRCLAGRAADFGVARILWTGSTAVYPDGLLRADEESVFVPGNDRARVLRDIERFLLEDPRFTSVAVRLAGLCGGGRKIGRFLSGQTLPTDGEEPVSLVHQDDAVAVLAALVTGPWHNEIFNVCADGHPTRRDLYTRAAQKMGLPPPQFTPGHSGPCKVVVNDKVKARLGYHFLHPDPMTFPD